MTTPTPPVLADSVQARLEGGLADLRAALPGFRAVHGALELAGPSLTLPCLAVVPLGEDIDPDVSPEATETLQRVLTTLAIVHGVPARNDPDGRKARTALRDLLGASRALLVGHVPARHWDPLALRRSRLLSLGEGRCWWQDEYITNGWRAAARA